MTIGTPLANYLSHRSAGGFVFASGVTAVDPATGLALSRYDQLSDLARAQLKSVGLFTGQTSVDVFEAPIAVQSYAVLSRIDAIAQECQVSLLETTRLVQYFRDLRHYPTYNRVRALFYPHGVVSTVLEVSRMLPCDGVLIEVEATLLASQTRAY